MSNTPFNKDLMIIQDDLNPLNVKWRLLTKWVDRNVLNKFINEYDQAVHDIIYP